MPRDFLVAVCALWLLAGVVRAQEPDHVPLPDAPSVSSPPPPPITQEAPVAFHKKIYWTLVAADAASIVADVQTSWHNEQVFPNGSEQNSWLFGRRPSLARYYVTDVAMDGSGAFLSYKLLHSRRKLFRTAGWVLLAGLVGQHTEGWIYNVNQHQKILKGSAVPRSNMGRLVW